ncbi:hypothetical protein GFD24_10145 [Bifidobacterium ramosum]|uniref:Uncharacterized protein n=1 Tax=Bifidobacterium ramosum TaxID=1798158 RepID=A0A7K3TDA0_9BIFI|nr:hypothetical protein [Bifidobacterium ramosum]
MPNQSANEDGIIIRADSRALFTDRTLDSTVAVYPVIAANLLSVSNVTTELCARLAPYDRSGRRGEPAHVHYVTLAR